MKVNYIIGALIIAVFAVLGCSKDDSSSDSSPSNPTGPPALQGGTALLEFEDGEGVKWTAHNITKNASSSIIYAAGSAPDGSYFELSVDNLTGNSTIPVGGQVGYLYFKNAEGEEFDTRIGGAGNVLIDRWDDVRLEARFLFPGVQSLGNEFMEFTNGKFAFNRDTIVSLSVEEVYDDWTGVNYVFVDRPVRIVNGQVTRETGPELGYTIEASTKTQGQIPADKINFSGFANTTYTIDWDWLGYTQLVDDEELTVTLKHGEEVIETISQSFKMNPIFGAFTMNAQGSSAPNTSTVTISPVVDPNRPNDAYEISGLGGQPYVFFIDQDGTIECTDTHPYMGSPVTSIYCYDDNATELTLTIHNGQPNYYKLIRQ